MEGYEASRVSAPDAAKRSMKASMFDLIVSMSISESSICVPGTRLSWNVLVSKLV